MEPMLDAPNAAKLFHRLAPYVTDEIWLGKMNHVRNCIGKNRTPEVEAAIQRIEDNQTDEKIWAIYRALKHQSKVRWKDSIRKVIGLEPTEVAA
jgi:valyl-tRNA synthetase